MSSAIPIQPRRITAPRKVAYAVLAVILALALLEGACRLVIPEYVVSPVRDVNGARLASVQALHRSATASPAKPDADADRIRIRNPVNDATGCTRVFEPQWLEVQSRDTIRAYPVEAKMKRAALLLAMITLIAACSDDTDTTPDLGQHDKGLVCGPGL